MLILSMAVQARIDCNLYVKCGTRARTRILDVKKMFAAVEQGTCVLELLSCKCRRVCKACELTQMIRCLLSPGLF